MPYSNVPKPLWGKMDDCITKVKGKGHSEKEAVAICYTSVVGSSVASAARSQLKKGGK